MAAISVNKISKSYRNIRALQEISFEVKPGELFGIIGPDGAGKTTLFRILTTLMVPEEGTATVNGLDVVTDYKEIRKQVGYMPGRFSLYQDMTVEENLSFFATLFGTTVRENYDLVKDIYQPLEKFKTRRAGKLSGGMKQKLALSCALIHKPSVLFLDEPTTGVDPVSRKDFWEMLGRLKKQGITIVVSTPYMDEAVLCDRIGLIREGQFMSIATPEEIINSYQEILWAVHSDKMSTLLSELRAFEGIKSCFSFGDTLHITVSNEQLLPATLKSILENNGHTDVDVYPIQATIEDCYMLLAK
jgi:ABC-2 type transport system ATP-binding protein